MHFVALVIFMSQKVLQGFGASQKTFLTLQSWEKSTFCLLEWLIFLAIVCTFNLLPRDKKWILLNFGASEMFFEMHQSLVKLFATWKWPGLQNARVRINVPLIANHKNVILAFFGNICVSLLNKLVCVTKRTYSQLLLSTLNLRIIFFLIFGFRRTE